MATFDNITFEIIEDSATKTDVPVKARIQYKDFDKEVTSRDIPFILNLFLNQENSSLTVDEFINKVRGELKQDPPTPENQNNNEKRQDNQDDDEDKKRKNRKKNKNQDGDNSKKRGKKRIVVTSIGVLVLAGVMMATGWYLCKNLDKDIDDKVDDNPNPYNQDVDNQDTRISYYPLPGEEFLPYINRRSTDLVMSEEDYLAGLQAQTDECCKYMDEICHFMETGELVPVDDEKKLATFIQSSFRDQSPDFCIVEHFNNCCNDIRNAAYNTRDPRNVMNIFNIHLPSIIRFCKNQEAVTLDTIDGVMTFYWNNITDEARNAIIDVLWSISCALPRNYTITVDGVNYNTDMLAQMVIEYRNNLTSLFNPTASYR